MPFVAQRPLPRFFWPASREQERMHNARRQMEEEAEERQRDLQNAMKDPKKAELYRQLRETMPETSISIK